MCDDSSQDMDDHIVNVVASLGSFVLGTAIQTRLCLLQIAERMNRDSSVRWDGRASLQLDAGKPKNVHGVPLQ